MITSQMPVTNSRIAKGVIANHPMPKFSATVLTESIRKATQQLADLIQQAICGQVWINMDYPTFSAWYIGEGLNEIRLTNNDSKVIIAKMLRDGTAIKAIARATGRAPNTVRNVADPSRATTKVMAASAAKVKAAEVAKLHALADQVSPRPKPVAKPAAKPVAKPVAKPLSREASAALKAAPVAKAKIPAITITKPPVDDVKDKILGALYVTMQDLRWAADDTILRTLIVEMRERLSELEAHIV